MDYILDHGYIQGLIKRNYLINQKSLIVNHDIVMIGEITEEVLPEVFMNMILILDPKSFPMRVEKDSMLALRWLGSGVNTA